MEWPKTVLGNVQRFVLNSGFFVQRMMTQLHSYHLDDNPDLRSCNVLIKALPENKPPGPTTAITDPIRLANFYGRDRTPKVHYVREKLTLDYGKAHDDEYYLELFK